MKGSPAHDPRHDAGLWSLGAGDHQHRRVRDFRLQLHEAENLAGLAFLWRVLGFHRRAVHRDVRFPADDLPAFGMAGAHLSGPRSILARCGTPVVDSVWAAGRSALERPAYAEHRGDFRRFYPAVRGVEGAL